MSGKHLLKRLGNADRLTHVDEVHPVVGTEGKVLAYKVALIVDPDVELGVLRVFLDHPFRCDASGNWHQAWRDGTEIHLNLRTDSHGARDDYVGHALAYTLSS